MNLSIQHDAMSIFQYIAEQRIREAYEKGEFDNLPRYGMPIDNSDYFAVPAEERIAVHIMKNAGIVPEEIRIRKRIYELTLLIKGSADQKEKDSLLKEIAFLEDSLFIKTGKTIP